MHRVQLLQDDALPESPSSPGITRHLAFKDEGRLVVRTRADQGHPQVSRSTSSVQPVFPKAISAKSVS